MQVDGLRRVRLDGLADRDGLLVAAVSTIDAGEAPTILSPDAAKQAAIVALEAIARQLPDLPQAPVVRALLAPHLMQLPADVQQQVLETDDPGQWVRALASALASPPGVPRTE